MTERSGAITFKGKPVTLVGNEISVGQPAPEFSAVGNDLSGVSLSAYRGKVIILSVVPSLDTPICDLQTKRFNEEAGRLGDNVIVLTVSMDLPFAQKRWCASAGASHVVTLSDYKDRHLGANFGLYVKELGLLARAVYVIDKTGVVRHAQLVKEIVEEPDYNAVLSAAKTLI